MEGRLLATTWCSRPLGASARQEYQNGAEPQFRRRFGRTQTCKCEAPIVLHATALSAQEPTSHRTFLQAATHLRV
jgi:hypothetical protein